MWGWEPSEETVHEYEHGRLVRSVTTREPEFDKEQYELVVALFEHEASLNELGIPVDEATSIEADPMNPAGGFRFEAKPIRDWSVQAKIDAEKDPRWSGENYSEARRWLVTKVMR